MRWMARVLRLLGVAAVAGVEDGSGSVEEG